MPNYNYQCQACHHIFEVTSSIKDMEKGNFPCEKCGSKNTKRLYDGFGFCCSTDSDDNGAGSCPTCQSESCSLDDD